MKFLDLNTGYSFDGLWTNYQSRGYIFWFPNEQSINITYSMPICLLTKHNDELNLKIEDNDIFSFVTHNGEKSEIDGYIFDTPIYSNELRLLPYTGEKVGNYYARIINIACNSKTEGEYICKININNDGFIRVGADFYGEFEPTYINLSNFGVEIPETIQKAIYDSNVHEDYKDNILINRKFKELLSNYWDIVANKGSYKSLLNSLKWFEWNDSLNIKEIWKRNEAGITMFDDREIMTILENKLVDTFENCMKTTYISLYFSAFDELNEYDSEYNPVIAETAMKWSKDDMKLKLSLLSQFFGTFFLPIHMSILHATVEDKIFTNTVKAIHGADINRDDNFGDTNYVECNVKDTDIYKIHNVRAQVTKDTMYGVRGDQDNISFGVDVFPKNGIVGDIESFSKQYYTGPGVIIPIEMIIPNQSATDFIKQTIVDFTSGNEKMSRLNFYNRIYCKSGQFKINFNFLAKEEMEYTLRFMFITGSSKTITRIVKFKVEDVDNLVINLYKVQAKDDSEGFTREQFLDMTNTEYFYKIQPNMNIVSYYTQCLPYMDPSNSLYSSYKGIKLNRTVVFDVSEYTDYDILSIRGLMDDDFLEFYRYSADNNMKYIVFVSKKFYGDISQDIINFINTPTNRSKRNIIRNELGFYPQFHDLVLMRGNSIDDYTINQFECICCSAEINNGTTNSRFKYGNIIDSSEWTFVNSSNAGEDIITTNASVRTPFITKEKNSINPGYYDIKFKYSLTNGITKECISNSAFRVKHININ